MTKSIVLAATLAVTTLATAQHQMPPGMTHEQHRAQMNQRGNDAMGFDQTKTTHHFLLRRDGGIIQVQTNDPNDSERREQIRGHLKQIAGEFAEGNFAAPVKTHAELPPGAATMRRMKTAITYTYEERPDGAAVRIASTNQRAIKAVHEFLIYQIKEHETGDPLTVAQ